MGREVSKHLYTWMEHENRKGSNMTLDHCLRQQLSGALRRAQRLRLLSDSCFGQNKNINLLSMLFSFMKEAFPRISAEYVFPIRGHSFLPVDRVFGRIEQQVRKKDTILMPEEYHQILRSHGNVHVYGQDWEAYDFKTETQAFVKSQKSFKLSEARMLEFRKEKLGFKAVYSGEYCYHSVLKRGKWANFKPSQVPKESTVKEAKRKDVLNLLSEIGVSDNVRAFYDDALSQSQMNDVDCDSHEE
ncbi:Phosphoribosyl-AMP cyclohydrolase [Dissostichus eleginoides]|uniref:Phosphoribosyl-AMP cyclohydrolase n=1 Tax=Dissostichus eleginoides TaxID=100907 RepID=A0AAD9BRK8_DISEL|nr:Phosphoribosyl-AMP cyclohydrolase [Dissostichus eleginoides]